MKMSAEKQKCHLGTIIRQPRVLAHSTTGVFSDQRPGVGTRVSLYLWVSKGGRTAVHKLSQIKEFIDTEWTPHSEKVLRMVR